jgi:hypothetical protein
MFDAASLDAMLKGHMMYLPICLSSGLTSLDVAVKFLPRIVLLRHRQTYFVQG